MSPDPCPNCGLTLTCICFDTEYEKSMQPHETIVTTMNSQPEKEAAVSEAIKNCSDQIVSYCYRQKDILLNQFSIEDILKEHFPEPKEAGEVVAWMALENGIPIQAFFEEGVKRVYEQEPDRFQVRNLYAEPPDVAGLRAEVERLREEKHRRIYYQSIVYDVCNRLDAHIGVPHGNGIVCGTVNAPTKQVQETLDRALSGNKSIRDELAKYKLQEELREATGTEPFEVIIPDGKGGVWKKITIDIPIIEEDGIKVLHPRAYDLITKTKWDGMMEQVKSLRDEVERLRAALIEAIPILDRDRDLTDKEVLGCSPGIIACRKAFRTAEAAIKREGSK